MKSEWNSIKEKLDLLIRYRDWTNVLHGNYYQSKPLSPSQGGFYQEAGSTMVTTVVVKNFLKACMADIPIDIDRLVVWDKNNHWPLFWFLCIVPLFSPSGFTCTKQLGISHSHQGILSQPYSLLSLHRLLGIFQLSIRKSRMTVSVTTRYNLAGQVWWTCAIGMRYMRLTDSPWWVFGVSICWDSGMETTTSITSLDTDY